MSGWKGGRGGGYGGGRGGGGQFNGLIRANGTNRFCSSCGSNIQGLATAMRAKCPFTTCGEPIPLVFGPSEGEFDEAGWGRCANCKSFIFHDHLYCQSCRYINNTAKERKEVRERQAMAKRQHQLKKANDEKDAKIARLEEEKMELNLIVGQQEALLFARAAKASEGDGKGNDMDAGSKEGDS